SRNPASTSSPCAISMSAACATLCPKRSSTPWTTPRESPLAWTWTSSIPPTLPDMRDVMSEALKYAMDDTAGVAVSLDMDFVDPGVGTPVRGGATYREAHLAMEMIADTESMASMEVVEINPILDEHNRTALLGVELVLSALGQKIL